MFEPCTSYVEQHGKKTDPRKDGKTSAPKDYTTPVRWYNDFDGYWQIDPTHTQADGALSKAQVSHTYGNLTLIALSERPALDEELGWHVVVGEVRRQRLPRRLPGT